MRKDILMDHLEDQPQEYQANGANQSSWRTSFKKIIIGGVVLFSTLGVILGIIYFFHSQISLLT